jgi:hypothetical protein
VIKGNPLECMHWKPLVRGVPYGRCQVGADADSADIRVERASSGDSSRVLVTVYSFHRRRIPQYEHEQRAFSSSAIRPLPPHLWIALQVHDRNDEDAVGPDLVEDSVRKQAYDAAARTGGEQGPASGNAPIRAKADWTSLANT